MNITTETLTNPTRVLAKGGGKQNTRVVPEGANLNDRHAEGAFVVAQKHGLTDAVSCEQVSDTVLRFVVL